MELPLWFIIILLLIICFLIYYLNNCLDVEAFGNNHGVGEGVEVIIDGVTDASAIKLTDDFFYFIDGAQVLQLEPSSDSLTQVADNLNDIDKYIFYSRQGNIKNVDKGAGGDAFTVDSSVLERSFIDYYFSQTINPIEGRVMNNQLIYIPYGNSTFIHVIEHPLLPQSGEYTPVPGTEKHKTFYSVFKQIDMKSHSYTGNTSSSSGFEDIVYKDPVTSFTSGQVSNNYVTANVEFKGVDIHQIRPNVFYHYTSGTLLVKEAGAVAGEYKLAMIEIPKVNDSGLTITRHAGTDTNNRVKLEEIIPQEIVDSFSFRLSYVYPDLLDGNLILYLKNGIRAAICTLRRKANGLYGLIGVVRFNGTQLNSYTGPGQEEEEDIDGEEEGEEEEEEEESDEEGEESGSGPSGDIPGSMDDYYKWYWYWNTSGSMPVHFSEDYMLKTQVVPPVCPACPSCPSGGNCNNCGGNGGNGTQDSNGKSMVNSKTGSELGGAYGKTLDTASDLLKSAGAGAKSVIDNTMGLSAQAVKGTTGLAKDTVQGAAGLAKDTVQGGVGLAKDTVQGGLDIAGDVLETGLDAGGNLATGTAGLIRDLGQGGAQINNTSGSTGQGSIYGGNSGTYGAPMGSGYNTQSRSPLDPYTYNGKLKNRPASEFLPRTADFSSFAK